VSQDEFDDVDGEEGGGSPFNLKVLLLYGAWRSKHWIGLCTLLGTVGGLVAAASMPNVYQSVGKLDYRPGIGEGMTETSVTGFEGVDSRNVPGMATELDLLEDLTPYLDVARKLGPAYILGTPDPTEGDEDAGLVTRLWHGFQKTMISVFHSGVDESAEVTEKAILGAAKSLKARTNLYVPPRSQTSIIAVQHDGYSPDKAQATNQAILRALQDFHLSLYATGSIKEAAEATLAQVEHEIKVTDAELQQHTSMCGYKNLEVERNNKLIQISEDKKSVSQLETDIAGLERKIAQLNRDLNETNPIIEEIEPAKLGVSTEYKFEQETLLNMKREKAELDAKGGIAQGILENLAKKITEQENKLALVEKHEEVEPARIVPKANELYNSLFANRAESESELEDKRGQLEILQRHIRDNEDHVRKMDECRELHKEKLSYLELKYTERDLARKNLQTTQDQASLEKEGISALRLRNDASMPLQKTGPNRTKPLGAGIFGGLALGMLLAVLRQLLDPTVRYRETVEQELDMTILAVVPESRALRRIKPGHVNVA